MKLLEDFSLEKCHGDVDYSRNMYKNLVTLSYFALNQCLFGITRGALAKNKIRKK